jgi:alpha-beta hydrolase superfamily lysophospholipase
LVLALALLDGAWTVSAMGTHPVSNEAATVPMLSLAVWAYLHLLLLGALALALVLWCAGSLYLYLSQESKFYPGDGAPFGGQKAILELNGKALRVEREGLALRWYEVPSSTQALAWVLVYHGNRGGAGERADFAKELRTFGLNVALVEYPGYAGDKGETGEWPILRHALAVYDEISFKAQGLPLLLLGESLGTGPATFVASRRDCLGLVLSTPYTSMADVAAFRYPWLPVRPLTTHPVLAKAWARHVLAPVQVLHGTADRTVPYFLGKQQSGNFKNLKEFVSIEGAGHADLRSHDSGIFWKRVGAFVGDCLSSRSR